MAEVMVGCKLPNGLILEIFAAREKDEANMPQKPPVAKAKVTLLGSNSLRQDKRAAQGQHEFAFTRVDKAFWDEWIRVNADHSAVKAGLIICAPNEKDARAEAKENRGEKTGLEAMNPEGDARLPKSSNPNAQVSADPASLAPRSNDAREAAQ